MAGFALSAAFAGAAGAAMAVRWTYIDPTAVFNPIGLQTVLIAIVGGPLKLTGPLLAAVVSACWRRSSACSSRTCT